MGLFCPLPGPLPTPHSGLPVPSSLLSLNTHYHHHPIRPIHPGRLPSLPSQSTYSCHLHNYPCPASLPLTSLTSHHLPLLASVTVGSPNIAPGQGPYPEEVSLGTCISAHQRDVTPRQRDAPKTAGPIFFFFLLVLDNSGKPRKYVYPHHCHWAPPNMPHPTASPWEATG